MFGLWSTVAVGISVYCVVSYASCNLGLREDFSVINYLKYSNILIIYR